MSQPEQPAAKRMSQRRSQRLLLRVPIVVERQRAKGPSAPESTETLAVNAHGALILLTPPVDETEQIIVKNPKTKEEMMCRLVHVGAAEAGKLQVGIEFTTPSALFWRVAFPPEDWASYMKDSRPATKE
jgi:hypothetical protein